MLPIRYALLLSYDYSKWTIFTKNRILQLEILNLGGCKVGVKNFWTKLPKGTPLRQIWPNKSFGLCGSDVVLTLYDFEEKKYAGIAIGNSMSPITLQPLPRCRDD